MAEIVWGSRARSRDGLEFSIPVDDLEGVGRNLLDFQVLLLDLQPLPAEPEREALHEGEALQVGHDRRALRRAYVCSNFLSSFWLILGKL